MIQPIEKYNRLYKEHVSGTNEAYIFTERLEIRSKHFNWNIKPHIHPGIHQLFLIEKGTVILHTGQTKQQINSPCLILIPATIVHGFNFSEDSVGSILSLNSSMADEIVSVYENLVSMFSELEIISLEKYKIEQNRITQVLGYIDNELNEIYPEKHGMLQTLLQEVFIIIFRLWKNKQDLKANNTDYRSLKYFRKFQLMLRNADNKTTIQQIANNIGITTVHLNRICNQAADKPASKLIHEHLIQKAKNYLIYTSYSISEIAYSLNFEYPNYFSRFFKKHTGLSPVKYRSDWNTIE